MADLETKSTASEPTTLPPLTLDPEYRHDPLRNTDILSWNFLSLALVPYVIQAFPCNLKVAVLLYAVVLAYALYIPAGRLIRPAVIRARLSSPNPTEPPIVKRQLPVP
jgi:hypothetical protein